MVRIKAQSLFLRYFDPETNREVVRHADVCSQRKQDNLISIGFAFSRELRQTA